MVVELKPSKSRLVDAHDVLLFRTNEQAKKHLVTERPEQRFIDHLKAEVLPQSQGLETLEDCVRLAYEVFYPRNKLLNIVRRPLGLEQARDWKVVDRPALAKLHLDSKNIFDVNLPKIFGAHHQYLDDYELNPYYMEQSEFTICSGTPYWAWKDFSEKIKDVKDNLNPEMSILLNPDSRRSSINSKIAQCALVSAYSQVELDDNDYYVALWVSKICNIRVNLTITYAQARQQDHVAQLGVPSWFSSSSNGEIVFAKEGESPFISYAK